MASPAVIKPQMQLGGMDCVIAALCAILAKPYEEIAAASLKIDPNVQKAGLTWQEACRVAKLVGVGLTSHSISKVERPNAVTWDDLESATGVLFVRKGHQYHAVVLFNGSLFNPSDGLLYQIDTYFASSHTRPWRLLLP